MGDQGGRRKRIGGIGVLPLASFPFALLVLALCLLDCGDSSRPSGPADPAGLTAQGWTRFEQGDLSGAAESFGAAIAANEAYGPAWTGRGWARLGLAADSASMGTAVADFDQAVALGADGSEVRAGRAAALLACGPARSVEAIRDARTTRRTAPQFVFAHRTSFDRKDLHLIEAFGQAASGHPDSALAAGDSIEASGILAQEPATWRVGGIDFESFEATVFAFLATLSDRYSG